MPKYTLAIHGGAGTILRSEMTAEKEKAHQQALLEALRAGEALLEAVLAESTPPGEPIDTGDVETDLREFFRRLTTRARRGPDDSGFAHVVARAHRHRGFAEMRRQRMDRRLEPLRAILRRGVERGELRADLDLDDVAVDLVAPVFFRRFFLGETPSQERIDRAIHDFLARSRPM